MNEELLNDLLDQYLTGSINDHDKAKLAQLIEQPQYLEKLQLLMEETFRSDVFLSNENQKLKNQIQSWLEEKINEDDRINPSSQTTTPSIKPFRRNIRWMQTLAAAAVLLLFIGSASYYFYLKSHLKNEVAVKPSEIPDVQAPLTNKATVRLADGRTVTLDSITNGLLVQQGEVKLVKLANGQIEYQSSSANIKEVQYNTISNPRGSRIIDMTLTDGSHVWLNAESSITFPIAFTTDERKVSITGEAYFEVSKDPLRKFIVSANGTTTEVLGTHFNVNTYADESSIKVTLLEGSVKVSKGNAIGLLKPGQQAQITSDVKVVSNIDVDAVMAWKNGYFHFSNTTLSELMNNISRWYDIDVDYSGKIPQRVFGGEIPRNAGLMQVVKILNESGIKCRMENKKLIIE